MTSKEISAAVILAAGRGERMRPLSLVVPKPALPLPGAPVIASAIDLAVETGARQIVVNAWHLRRARPKSRSRSKTSARFASGSLTPVRCWTMQ